MASEHSDPGQATSHPQATANPAANTNTNTSSNSNPLFKPTLILHGGAGNIHRSRLPPALYARYRASLLSYLRSTADLLSNGATALDAAVHAVASMEDDDLFNCGRGSVFTTAGTVEMEASVMVCSVKDFSGESGDGDGDGIGLYKRGAGVMMLRNVRYPVRLAREVLLRDGRRDGQGGGSMHCQLAGPHVEKLAAEWGLEFKPDEWFWTERRWDEHKKGLKGEGGVKATIDLDGGGDELDAGKRDGQDGELGHGLGDYLSQGTVGCVCLDKWGNLAVATSTGGLTNKFPGRIGDTPTLGAGFWAESWDEEDDENTEQQPEGGRLNYVDSLIRMLTSTPEKQKQNAKTVSSRRRRRAVALSGTGNGDAFLRVAAARTTAAIARFSTRSTSDPETGSSSKHVSLANAVRLVAGPGGELARSTPGLGTGGIIGVEMDVDVEVGSDDDETMNDGSRLRRGKVVFDFNCGGMFRAWIEEGEDGVERERVMVFREEYE